MRCTDHVKNIVSLRACCTSFCKETQFPRWRCRACLIVYMFAWTDHVTNVREIFNLLLVQIMVDESYNCTHLGHKYKVIIQLRKSEHGIDVNLRILIYDLQET